MRIQITVNRSMNNDEIYQALLNSGYMKRRGYRVLYSKDYGRGDYGLCHYHHKDLIFIHFRVLDNYPPNTFSYFTTLGEKSHKNQIDLDLKELAKEIETSP